METKLVNKEIEIHSTPLEVLHIRDMGVEVEFDDIHEERWRFIFRPYQALKITTIDCFNTTPLLFDGKRPAHLIEVINSQWLTILKAELFKKDQKSDFLDKAKHYIFPFQDSIIEVVAWGDYTIQKI